MILKKILI